MTIDLKPASPPIDLPAIPRRRLLGVPCHAVTIQQACEFALASVAQRTPRHMLYVNAAKVVNARNDERLMEALERADLVGADGQPMVWVSRLLRQPIPQRINGTNFMLEVLRLASQHQWRVFLLGSTEPVLEAVRAYCRREFPDVVLAGSHHGYFSPQQGLELADTVARTSPDVLLVGMPSPDKEYWLSEYGERAQAPLGLAVGGSFEVLAGVVRRAPESWQAVGMEWLWRTIQEPRRLWRRYLVTNTQFIAIVAFEWLRSQRN